MANGTGPGRNQPVQHRADLDTRDFILSAERALYIQGTYLEDGGRSIDLEPNTLLAKRASSQKWRAFVNEAATNGEAIPAGIYAGPTILAADIVAGDVDNLAILIAAFPVEFDEDMLIIENAKTLETVITVGTTDLRVVRDYLRNLGLIPRLTTQASGGQN
jgi:hypothetical protein